MVMEYLCMYYIYNNVLFFNKYIYSYILNKIIINVYIFFLIVTVNYMY